MCPAGPIFFKDALRKSAEYSKTNTKLHFLLRPGYQKCIKNNYKCGPQGRFCCKTWLGLAGVYQKHINLLRGTYFLYESVRKPQNIANTKQNCMIR